MASTETPLTVDGLANVRDLGGLTRSDGTVTPYGVFLRSEILDRVTTKGWHALRERGVTTVIDLRRPQERTRSVPDAIDMVAVDLDGDERHFWEPIEADGKWGTPLYYVPHLAELPHRMRAVLDAIARAREGAVLFHCGAGWDRTGFVSAILLRAIGATPEAAAADYLRSFDNADAMTVLHGRPAHVDERLAIMKRYDHTPESAFLSVYRELDVDGWFASAGVAPATRTAIRTWRGMLTRP